MQTEKPEPRVRKRTGTQEHCTGKKKKVKRSNILSQGSLKRVGYKDTRLWVGTKNTECRPKHGNAVKTKKKPTPRKVNPGNVDSLVNNRATDKLRASGQGFNGHKFWWGGNGSIRGPAPGVSRKVGEGPEFPKQRASWKKILCEGVTGGERNGAQWTHVWVAEAKKKLLAGQGNCSHDGPDEKKKTTHKPAGE